MIICKSRFSVEWEGKLWGTDETYFMSRQSVR